MKYKFVIAALILLSIMHFNCLINHKLIRHNSNVLKGSYWQLINCNYSDTLNAEDTTIFHFSSNYELLIINNNKDTIFGYYKAESIQFISYIYIPNFVKLDRYYAELPNRLVNMGQLRFAEHNYKTFKSLYNKRQPKCYRNLMTKINLTYNNETIKLKENDINYSLLFLKVSKN